MTARATYIAYRLKRAREALQETRLLFDAGHYNTTINRLYYACFYAVSSLLLANKLTAARHAGVLRLFNEHFILPGPISAEMGLFYKRLFQFRQKSDYDDEFLPDPERIAKWLPEAEAFVERISQLVAETSQAE
jgi:hypothetical protein